MGCICVIVKICGNTNAEDILAADSAGADFIGVVVEVPASKRSVTREHARELFKLTTRAQKVVLLCNHNIDEALAIRDFVGAAVIHLTGEEPPAMVDELLSKAPPVKILKSIHLPAGEGRETNIAGLLDKAHDYKSAGASLIVLDASDPARKLYGGTGKTVNWDIAREFTALSPLPVLLAGGITPENVRDAIEKVNPYGVDMASGVESAPGKKDPDKIRLLFENIRKLR